MLFRFRHKSLLYIFTFRKVRQLILARRKRYHLYIRFYPFGLHTYRYGYCSLPHTIQLHRLDDESIQPDAKAMILNWCGFSCRQVTLFFFTNTRVVDLGTRWIATTCSQMFAFRRDRCFPLRIPIGE